MEIIDIKDVDPVPTSTYNLINYDKFIDFNPVQSSVLPHVEKDSNFVVSASTSSGKTVIAEFFISNAVLQANKKAIYVSPLRALASEKYSEWNQPNHEYSKKKIGYFTEGNKSKDEFQIGIFTIEGLCHKLMTKSELFKDLEVVIIDEAHLLGAEGRGHFLEFVIMFLSKISNCKFVLLSGTLPNGIDISNWLCKMNNKSTYFLKSSFRPVPLNVHYRKYDDSYFEDGIPSDLTRAVLGLISRHQDKFLIFVHSKATGKKLKKIISQAGYTCDFHCADLKPDERSKVETAFKTGDIRILVATSTLAAGVNLPARRVIIFGVCRGTMMVDKAEIGQMMGRAGRKGIDPEGDVYIYMPEKKQHLVSELKKIDPVKSTLLLMNNKEEYFNIALFIMGLIYTKSCKTDQDILDFINTSFASTTSKINTLYFDKTINTLVGCKFLEKENEFYKITKLGALSCHYFINPYDLYSYQKNFYQLVKSNCWKDSLVSYALGNIQTNNKTYISNDETSFCFNYASRLQELIPDRFYQSPAVKYGYAYWCLMNGTNLGPLLYLREPLINDSGRIMSCLSMMSKICGWNNPEFFHVLQKRIMYGVRKELIGLVEIKNIGRVRAELLYSNGFKNRQDVLNNLERASKILSLSVDFLKSSCCQDQKTQQDIQS